MLPDGRIFVAGGSTALDAAHPIGYPASTSAGNATRKTALYDPASNTWTAGPDLAKPLMMHVAGLLSTNKVLIAGGVEVPIAGTATTTAACQLFDPLQGSMSATQSMALAAAGAHEPEPAPTPTPAPAPVPKLTVQGGAQIDFTSQTTSLTNATQDYDAASGNWTFGPSMSEVVMCRSIVCMPNGTKLGTGGITSLNLAAGTATQSTSIDVYDPSTQTWMIGGALTTPRPGLRHTLVDDGKRLLVTGAAAGMGGPDLSADCYVSGP
jgi:hypothetical protein